MITYPISRRARYRHPLTSATVTPPSRARSREWYRITNRGDAHPEVWLYDDIGEWGITAREFTRDLQAITAPNITLRVSSHGGSVFEGLAILNALRRHPAHITTHVDSLAASIASVIAMAGDVITVAPGAQFMVHDAMGVCAGNASDMAEMMELLDRQSANISSIYAERAGGTVEEWRGRMRRETWFSAEEAVEVGLADEVEDLGTGRTVDRAAGVAATARTLDPQPDQGADELPAVDVSPFSGEHAALIRQALVSSVDQERWPSIADTFREAMRYIEPTADERGWWGGAGRAW